MLVLKYLLNGVFFPSHLCHISNVIYVVLQSKLQAAGEGQIGLGHDFHLNALGKYPPVTAPQPRVPQALDQRNMGKEVLDLATDHCRHHLAVWCHTGGKKQVSLSTQANTLYFL